MKLDFEWLSKHFVKHHVFDVGLQTGDITLENGYNISVILCDASYFYWEILSSFEECEHCGSITLKDYQDIHRFSSIDDLMLFINKINNFKGN